MRGMNEHFAGLLLLQKALLPLLCVCVWGGVQLSHQQCELARVAACSLLSWPVGTLHSFLAIYKLIPERSDSLYQVFTVRTLRSVVLSHSSCWWGGVLAPFSAVTAVSWLTAFTDNSQWCFPLCWLHSFYRARWDLSLFCPLHCIVTCLNGKRVSQDANNACGGLSACDISQLLW